LSRETSILGFLLQGFALGLSAAASPGPFQTFLISQSLDGGWRRGAPVAFAPLFTDLPIILVTQLLLGRVPEFFLRGVSLAGGLFVLYLAWGLWRGWRSGAGLAPESRAAPDRRLRWGVLGRAIFVNFLSPGPYLFWALVNGPILLSGLRRSPLHGGAFLFGFYGVFVAALLALAILFHQARRMGRRMVRALLLASILILILFGGLLLEQGLRG
jgi:threonine/homoserine/homoserine lactone efflux protein